MPTRVDITEARLLAQSWQLSLRAERKSDQTLRAYAAGVDAYLSWCAATPADPFTRAALNLWVAGLLDAGSAPATARSRQLAVRRFSAWLAAEGELDVDPFLGVKAPKLDERVVEPLSDDEVRAMLRACTPPKGATAADTLRHRRDEALIRFMFETGTRAGEVVALHLDDIDLPEGTAVVRRGKGGKGRVVPFGPHTTLALDRYIRLRRGHRLADTPNLWLGDRSKGFSYDALHKTLAMRADQAGVVGFHPHKLRHTAAHRWLAAGGSESGLMAVAGWTRPDMLMRYTKAQASARAADEAKTLNLGDLLSDLSDLFRASDERTRLATETYDRLRAGGNLSSHRLIAYRCPRRCLLVDVIGLPQGIVLHSPAYKLSPTVNAAESSASGRAVNTTDGVRRWKAHTYFAVDAANVTLTCDHVRHVLDLDDLRADLDARHTEMVVMSDGGRHPR